jgi:outer membrane protein assembly factor BamC
MPKRAFSGVLMNRQLFYFSVISLTLSACSSVDNKRAQGDFDYAKKQVPKDFIVPDNLDQPKVQQEFLISDKINYQGPVGLNMDIRAPSLVLPLAASSRVESESSDALIWFDKVLEDKDLLVFIRNSLISQLMSDNVSYDTIKISNESENGTVEVYESQWYHSEVETGWLFTDIELSTSMRFRYEFLLKPHGRSASLQVSLIDFMKTNKDGGSKTIDPIDKQRAEMAMLNKVVGQVDYNYRLQQRENRLMRANQKLVTIG